MTVTDNLRLWMRRLGALQENGRAIKPNTEC